MNRQECNLKLANEFHLNIEDRGHFQDSPITLDEFSEAIEITIATYGGYPKGWHQSKNFDGVYLTLKDGTYCATYKAEVGMNRFSLIEELQFPDIKKAAGYITKKMFPKGIDDVPFDW